MLNEKGTRRGQAQPMVLKTVDQDWTAEIGVSRWDLRSDSRSVGSRGWKWRDHARDTRGSPRGCG